MAIKSLDISKETESYQKLLGKQEGSVFNSPEWLKIYGEHLKLYGIYNNNNELTGSFYFFTKKKYGAEFSICPPFSPHNGLFYENRAENSANINTFNKAVLTETAEFIDKMGAKLLIFTLPSGVLETQPFIWKKMEVKVKYTYHIDLSLTREELWANLSSEKRKSVNKAEKDSLQIEKSEDMKPVKEMIMKTFGRKEISKNIDLFDKILFEFAKPENSFAFVARQDGKAIAATFCVHDKNASYYLFGGYDAESKHHGAGVMCMWQSILHAKKLGLKTFDFEGSMIPEVEKYFREFGGTLVPYYSVSKASLPVETIMKLTGKSI